LGSISWTEVEPYTAPHWKERSAYLRVAKDYPLGGLLLLSLQQSVSFLPAVVEGTRILYHFCQVNIFNTPKNNADDFLQACEP